MWKSIECAGHPRDMGLAQGEALGAAIRAECKAAGLPLRRSRLPTLTPLVSGAVRGRGAGREFMRHFAHQAERLEGLARAADVPVDSVIELHLRVRAGGAEGGLLSRRSSLRAYEVDGTTTEKHTRFERSLPKPGPDEGGWVVRESQPVVGFRSVEVGLPWLVSGVAGVNETGLVAIAGPILWAKAGVGCAAPSALLVQECLQRFEDLAGALDWCEKRPVEGEQSIVLGDASGAVATVISSRSDRRISLGEGELYLEGGEPSERGSASESEPDRVELDPQTRSLRLEANGTEMTIEIA